MAGGWQGSRLRCHRRKGCALRLRAGRSRRLDRQWDGTRAGGAPSRRCGLHRGGAKAGCRARGRCSQDPSALGRAPYGRDGSASRQGRICQRGPCQPGRAPGEGAASCLPSRYRQAEHGQSGSIGYDREEASRYPALTHWDPLSGNGTSHRFMVALPASP